MKIIILGAGQVGRTAAYHLAREEANEVTVVDMNDDVLRDLQDRLDIRTVVGRTRHVLRRNRRRLLAQRFPSRERTNYPLLFDRQGKPKDALHAVLAAAKSK